MKEKADDIKAAATNVCTWCLRMLASRVSNEAKQVGSAKMKRNKSSQVICKIHCPWPRNTIVGLPPSEKKWATVTPQTRREGSSLHHSRATHL